MLFNPYDAKDVAMEDGIVPGHENKPYEGNYETKGLFAFKTGIYAGHAFFGTGGSKKEMSSEVKFPKWRPKIPDIFTPKGAFNIAKYQLGLKTNENFEGSVGPEKGRHHTYGFYAYKSGKYAGYAFFGTGGTIA